MERTVIDTLEYWDDNDEKYTVRYENGWTAMYAMRHRGNRNGIWFRVDIRKDDEAVFSFIRQSGSFDTNVGMNMKNTQGGGKTKYWYGADGVPVYIMMEVFLTMFDEERFGTK